jgi:hypothetical protein
MNEKIFKAISSENDRVSFEYYVILPLMAFFILGLVISIASGSLILAVFFFFILFILGVWFAYRLLNKGTTTKYRFTKIGVVISPLDFFLSMHLKEGVVPYEIISGIDVLTYGSGYRKDYLPMRLDYKYSIIGTGDSWIPERAIVVHTDREMSPLKMMSISFTPEDFDGFFSELKAKIKKKIEIRNLEV